MGHILLRRQRDLPSCRGLVFLESRTGAIQPVHRRSDHWNRIASSQISQKISNLTLSDRISYLANAIGKDHAFVARTTRLTLLAPEIIHAILSGSLQRNIPIENFRKEMPIHWEDQKKLFGFE